MEVVLVIGPPGSGKSTMVDEQREPGDLVIDYDRIVAALGGRPWTDDLRHEAVRVWALLVDMVATGTATVGRAWLISTDPGAEYRFRHDRLIVVDPGFDEAMRRADAAGRPVHRDGIHRWYEERASPSMSPRRIATGRRRASRAALREW